MKWVTRNRPHVDRCASLWLIKNFVDSEAEFAFVSRDYAWNENEIPLVLPGAELSPKEGKTTFELIIQKHEIKDKIIILVGSSKPEKFYDSDAPFNVGTAVGAINILNKGVYIAMNGRIYTCEECQKDKETGQFVERNYKVPEAEE